MTMPARFAGLGGAVTEPAVGLPLYTWGANENGQIGDSTSVSKFSPVQIGTLTDWASVNPGADHTLATKTNGTLWAWGSGTNGQLGDGTTVAKSSPVQIGTLTDWASVSAGAGGNHSLAIKTGGTLWAWGLGSSGQLGINQGNVSSPVFIGNFANVAISGHALAVSANGTLWAWGLGSNGQLGDGTTVSKSSPVQIGTLTDWASVTAGSVHSLAIKTNGTLWAWGAAGSGQLGDGTIVNKSSPVQIGTLTDWASGVSLAAASSTSGAFQQ